MAIAIFVLLVLAVYGCYDRNCAVCSDGGRFSCTEPNTGYYLLSDTSTSTAICPNGYTVTKVRDDGTDCDDPAVSCDCDTPEVSCVCEHSNVSYDFVFDNNSIVNSDGTC
jgi:hypothetical protein